MSADGDEPIYERVGGEPLEDADLDAAIAAWQADHFDADELQVWGAERRLRQLNAEARKRANERREAEAAGTTTSALKRARAEERQSRAAEREAQELATARRLVAGEGSPSLPTTTDHAYLSLDEIEAARRKLAAAGKPHGWDALGGKSYDHPFPGQRSTIRRRYRDRPPPGTFIEGVFDGGRTLGADVTFSRLRGILFAMRGRHRAACGRGQEHALVVPGSIVRRLLPGAGAPTPAMDGTSSAVARQPARGAPGRRPLDP